MTRDHAKPSEFVFENSADVIVAELKSIRDTMLTRTSVKLVWVLANLAAFGLMAVTVAVLHALGAFAGAA